jgi:hypothetical protein
MFRSIKCIKLLRESIIHAYMKAINFTKERVSLTELRVVCAVVGKWQKLTHHNVVSPQFIGPAAEG